MDDTQITKEEAIRLRDSGLTYRQIAEKTETTKGWIYQLINSENITLENIEQDEVIREEETKTAELPDLCSSCGRKLENHICYSLNLKCKCPCHRKGYYREKHCGACILKAS